MPTTDYFQVSQTLTVTNGVYSVADVVGGLLTFANVSRGPGRRSEINQVTLTCTVGIAYELWLFASDIATPAADNAVFALVQADISMCKGVIAIPSTSFLVAQTAFAMSVVYPTLPLIFSCVATTLYGYLKATATTTPATTVMVIGIAGYMLD